MGRKVYRVMPAFMAVETISGKFLDTRLQILVMDEAMVGRIGIVSYSATIRILNRVRHPPSIMLAWKVYITGNV